MSKKPQNVRIDAKDLPASYYRGAYLAFDFHIQRVEGKLLTLIESLGLREGQEKATKDLVRDTVHSLYQETHYLNGDLVTEVLNKKYELEQEGKFIPSEQPPYVPVFN